MKTALWTARGQTALEYLLLCGLIAFIVFMSFAPGGFMSKVHDTSNQYYEKITNVIMGDNPAPINGGWCAWSACPASGAMRYRTCECPAPAFGGAYCQAESGIMGYEACM